jgi:transcriptional regulator with XRE-family HTH domain
VWVQPKEHKVVGAALAAARRRAGLTQTQLAKSLRKPQSFVSSYERGQRRLDILEFLRVADAIGANALAEFESIHKAAKRGRR